MGPHRTQLLTRLLIATLLVAVAGCSRQNPIEPRQGQVDVSLSNDVVSTDVQRPLSDFLDAQGSTNIFIPPIPDFIGWSSAIAKPPIRFASVDYAGLAGEYLANAGGPVLGTEITGSVSERRLRDGRAEVSVHLHGKNALTWAMLITDINNFDVAHDPTIYGHRATEIVANPALIPSVSNFEMLVTFINTAPRAPLPDLITFILGNTAPGQELVKLIFHSSGTGFLADDRTPAKCTVTQTGLFKPQPAAPSWDAFPAERVEIRIIGGGRGRGTAGS